MHTLRSEPDEPCEPDLITRAEPDIKKATLACRRVCYNLVHLVQVVHFFIYILSLLTPLECLSSYYFQGRNNILL
jgi:hypothetical protein